jgi:2,3-bisphosphoglycerate-independent phosphoglycerate mutase
MILDGYGHRDDTTGNAVKKANTPNLDRLHADYPDTLVKCSGRAVGLPEGVMGNSEVGHLNIGAGRCVKQEVVRIDDAIDDGSFFENEAMNLAVKNATSRGGCLHLMGLVSDGQVHSSDKHYFALIDFAKKKGLDPDKVFFHVLLDGRDTPPTSGAGYVQELVDYMRKQGVGRIATIAGRYWTMDRDKRWDRVQKGYRAMTLGEGVAEADPVQAIKNAYERGENDEFVKPIVMGNGFEAFDGRVTDGDAFIFFNFRGDRARQISHAFNDKKFDGFERETAPDVDFVCFTQYEENIDARIAFPPQPRMKNIYGDVISTTGLKQLRIAETEKYAHVTYFFNGGMEEPFEGEDRILVDSPKVDTYDQQPEMSAYPVTDKLIEALESDKYDTIVLNFANLDMVGHTGVMEAAVKATEAVDECVGRVVAKVLEKGGAALVTADHGNAEEMEFADGSTQTQHTTNVVPLIYVAPQNKEASLRSDAALCDIAPTLLELLGVEKPQEMEGRSIVERS